MAFKSDVGFTTGGPWKEGATTTERVCTIANQPAIDSMEECLRQLSTPGHIGPNFAADLEEVVPPRPAVSMIGGLWG